MAIERPRSVWCTRCSSNMLASEAVVKRHLKRDHDVDPTAEEVNAILKNSLPEKEQRARVRTVAAKGRRNRARGLPLGTGLDHTDEHERRWRRTIQAGAPGLGKRK